MKRATFLLLVLLFFIGCKKEKEHTPNEQELWLSGYTAYSSKSEYKKDFVKFMFFKLNNGENIKADKKTFDGTLSDYMKLTDENYELLRKESKIKLESGNIISAQIVENCGRNDTSYRILSIPVGRYYVVAIYSGAVYFAEMYTSEYALKYAGQYIEVKYNVKPTVIDVVIPASHAIYGCIDWVRWNEKFPYQF